jgi:NAD(P)H-hydrate epimerase
MTDFLSLIPRRSPDAHKGDAGRVLIVAGSRGMAGAATLAARAALRAGAGLVTVATPAGIEPVIAAKLDDAMTLPLGPPTCSHFSEGAIPGFLAAIRPMDAIGVGPGLGTHRETTQFLAGVLEASTPPLILDADALNLVASDLAAAATDHAGPIVMTPHPGEMARLLGSDVASVQRDRKAAAIAAARKFGTVVVLKGAGTVITDGDRVAINATGNPGLATGGTGDVLTGVLTALIAQGLAPFDAARLAAYVHGIAGDFASERHGVLAMTASDVIACLPAAWRAVENDG